MATVTIPYTFVNGSQNADATQVNSNFSTLATFLNTEVIQRDASIAFTQIPTLPATNPTLANHATRKAYVDAYFPVTSANIADGAIVNADINAAAAIAYSKLALAGSIVNADVAAGAAIAYSKLNLAGSIVAADFAAAAKAVVICTSSTRPSTPVDGQMIYETDKDRVLVYDGSAWTYVAGLVGAGVSGSLAIANTVTSNLTYSSESLDTDSMIAASGSTFTVPFSGLYALTIDVSSASDMSGGFGSQLSMVSSTKTYQCNLFGTATTVTWLVPLNATNTARFQIKNSTGASVTYTYDTTLRMVGR